jgi:glycosyltransferase involved in cell wall biosynthesis
MTRSDSVSSLGQGGRILVDHTHCGRHVTGLERITLELFSREALAPLDVEIVGSSGLGDMTYKQQAWMPIQLLRDPKALLLCPGFPPSIPASLFGDRVLPYIHDMFLLNRRQDLNARARLYMVPAFRRAVTRLPHFLVNSETTRTELRAYARPDAQIELYRPAVRNVFGLTDHGRAERDTVTLAPRLVALGTLEPRKNLQAAGRILEAMRVQGFSDARLDIVGRSGWGPDEQRLAETPGVTLHGYQPIERVREIVGAADALICTSHDEGLGLPLLEAQYAGLAVIAPDRPVFHEVLGASGTFINPRYPAEAAGRIGAMFATPNWRRAAVASAAENLDRWLHLAAKDHGEVLEFIARLSLKRGAPC